MDIIPFDQRKKTILERRITALLPATDDDTY